MLMFSGCKLIHICVVLALTLSGAFTLSCSAGEKMPGPSVSPAEPTGQGTSMRVLWTVSSYLIMHKAAWGESEARAMLFKPLDISATTITFAGQACRDVEFASETVNAEKYLRERFGVTPQSLGLEDDTMQVVRTTCSLPGFDEYVRLRDRRLLVPIQGVLFVFTPRVNY